MTAKEYLEKKYPQMRGVRWNTNPVIDDNWVAQMMTEFAEKKVQSILISILETLNKRAVKLESYEKGDKTLGKQMENLLMTLQIQNLLLDTLNK